MPVDGFDPDLLGAYAAYDDAGRITVVVINKDPVNDVLIARNLYAHNNERNPQFKGGTSGQVINNLIYDPGPRALHYNLIAAEEVPGFVVGIFVSLFLFFNSFALNQWLQYRQVGPWRSYAFGERAYLVLSLVAKSALAWQIFAGSLAS